MTQYEETELEVIEYWRTNKENGVPTLSRIFNMPESMINQILNKHLQAKPNSMQ